MQDARKTDPGADTPRTLATLFAELMREVRALFQQEMALVRTELGEKIAQLGTGFLGIVAGGIVVFAGFVLLLEAGVLLLSLWIPFWLSALVLGILVVVLGAFFFQVGVKRLQARSLMPSVTIESIRRDTALLKEHL